MTESEYMVPCRCEDCRARKHCQRCREGNPGTHFLWTPDGGLVLSWFDMCFPQYRRKDGRVVMPEEKTL